MRTTLQLTEHSLLSLDTLLSMTLLLLLLLLLLLQVLHHYLSLRQLG